MQVLKRKQLMLVKVQQKIMTVITMTAPTVLLRAHQEAVPINLQELQAEVHQAEAAPVAEALQAAVAPAAVVQAAVPEAEVNLAEAALVATVPVAEVNLVEAAPVVENLPAVKVQNNV